MYIVLFHPPEPNYSTTDPFPVHFVQTKNGYFVPTHFHKPSKLLFSENEERKTIIFSHGNALDLETTHHLSQILANGLGVNVIAYDYIGYGLSYPQTKPTERLCYESLDAVIRHYMESMNIRSSNLYLLGKSIGSGPTIEAASHWHDRYDSNEGLGGVILECSFLSPIRIVFSNPFVLLLFDLFFDVFQNFKKISRICRENETNVMIIHGRMDQIVPFSHGETLYQQFFDLSVEKNENEKKKKLKKVFVRSAGHNNIIMSLGRDEYLYHYKEFLFDHNNSSEKKKNKNKKKKKNNDYEEEDYDYDDSFFFNDELTDDERTTTSSEEQEEQEKQENLKKLLMFQKEKENLKKFLLKEQEKE